MINLVVFNDQRFGIGYMQPSISMEQSYANEYINRLEIQGLFVL